MKTVSSSSAIELEYDTFGSPDDPALLLVMGFTAQMIAFKLTDYALLMVALGFGLAAISGLHRLRLS